MNHRNNVSLRNNHGAVMNRFFIIGTLLAAMLSIVGCNQEQGQIDRVQVNLVDKSIFEGEWWVLQSVITVDGDATGPTWDGDSGWGDLGVDGEGLSTTMARIRWVIDEDTLFAYRAYELIDGGNDDGRTDTFRGQPIAAFPIQSHLDIRQDYNSITGERTNVRVENTSDRRWYERDFMRVDWSQNIISSFTFAANMYELGGWRMESVPFQIDDANSHGLYPSSWAPQFVTVAEDEGYRFRDEWPADMQDQVHYFSIVTMNMLSPGASCLFIGGGTCQVFQVPMRWAFLRVPPNHEYAAADETHDEFDRFGLFRINQRTYVRGGRDTSTLRNQCDEDADCGAGAHCDPVEGICYGGLTSDLGETDFLTFYRPRHNFFARSFRDDVASCRQDWECSGSMDGSSCDRAARRCTIPLADREVRQVPYYLNPGHDAHMVAPAMEVVGNWNEVFMRGWRAARDEALPNYEAVNIDCQNTDPTRYCFCGSGDENPTAPGTCRGKYDAFVPPSTWESRGVVAPFDCYVANDEFSEPASPGSYDEYTLPGAYRYEFRGDECMMVLRTNTCDWYRTDASVACDDVVDADGNPVQYEQLGDIRYQFVNLIPQINTPFGGVAYPLSDVTNGEMLTANINYTRANNEIMVQRVLEWFPVLRCLGDRGCRAGDEGAIERFNSGENLRRYYDNLGNTEHPIVIAASGRDGISTDDPSRPHLPTGLSDHVRATLLDAMPRVENLRGSEGRAMLLSDRMRSLAGTHFESDLLASMGSQGRDLMQALYDTDRPYQTAIDPNATVTDDTVLNAVSPFRGNGFLRAATAEHTRTAKLGKLNMCQFDALDVASRNRYWEYFAEVFRDRPDAEASIRIQQMTYRMVQHHELGHSVGLRHNFGGSFDRNNYGDGFFNIVVGDPDDPSDDLDLPRLEDFDDPRFGGDADGFVGGSEIEAYQVELRRVRDARAARGAQNYMTGSTMDYGGDTSDFQGLGRYDRAATMWSYFDEVEAYVGDPRINSADSFNDMHLSSSYGRELWHFYRGGESCDVDNDCPASSGSRLVSDQPIYQRCIRNTRETRLPEPCAGDRNCVCSTFDEDFLDYVDGVAYNNDEDGDLDIDHYPVKYFFCGDERTNDISWCSRFDAGESFQEQIDHYRRRWEEGYVGSYYRNFRRGGGRGAASIGSIIDAAKVYQHLFFRVYYEPGFTSNEGPLGFLDQFLASIDSMNWFIELANLPDEGSYRFDADRNTYVHMGEDADMPGSDLTLEPGQGFGMWTKYQEGHQGFFRPERAGVFFDKFFAIYALAVRDWGLNFTLDERFYINYYDLFGVEMTEFFGGQALDNPTWFAPRLRMEGGEPVVENLSWYRGLTLGECNVGGRLTPCVPDQGTLYPDPAIEGTSNLILRSWSTILALAQFPVFYDTSFEQRLQIFKLDSGAGFDLADVQPDGTATCALNAAVPGSGHLVVDAAGPEECNSPDDADYVVYTSERFHTPYVAVKVKPRIDYNLEEEQLGFRLLERLSQLHERVEQLETDGAPTAQILEARRELQSQESFLEYLIELQAAYGISNTLF